MAIHRQAVSPPVAADEVARIRTELAPQYGAQVHEEGNARVLLIRVPRAEPDPVNDVEEAVEYLQPSDVEDITHCLLIGDERIAQVYARPLTDLMQQRIDFDRRQAAAWRERMPGRLGHALFQSPEDPRRRWRLAVRLPVESIKELDEEMLEDLADGLGPELETPRFKSLAAVYLIAATDHVRLEPDLFVQELLATWQDEERRRRLELELAQKKEAERRRKEEERAALLQDMERRIGKRTVRAPLRRAPLLESETTIRPRPEVRHVHKQIDRLARGPWTDDLQVTDTDARPAGTGRSGPWAAPVATDEDADGATPGAARGPGRDATPSPAPRGAGPDATTPGAAMRDGPDGASSDEGRLGPAMEAAREAAVATRRRHDEAHRELDSLRSRVDRALGRVHSDGADPTEHRPSAAQGAPHDGADQPVRGGAPVPGRTGITTASPPRDRSQMAPIDRARASLEDAGFDVLVRPDTPGHVIDLAGERPDGDPQRIVVRVVERLDTAVAKELLKTARELEVDLVLCVADRVEPEGRRILVATKVKTASPEDLDRFAF